MSEELVKRLDAIWNSSYDESYKWHKTDQFARELIVTVESLQRRVDVANACILAMADAGWLMCGAEGYDEVQQRVVDYLPNIPEYVARCEPGCPCGTLNAAMKEGT